MAKKVSDGNRTLTQDLSALPKLVETLGAKAAPEYEDIAKEIDPKEHAIFDLQKRPKKTILKPVVGADGKPMKNADGSPMTTQKTVEVNRIGLPLQEIIVTRRVAFMNLGKVKLFCEPKDKGEERAFNLLQRLRENNKLSFKESEIATILNKELQAAKLWYSIKKDDARHWGGLSKVPIDFKMQVLAPSKGDTLLPVFDNSGDLVYFGRGYEISRGVDELMADASDGSEDKKTKCLDIYSKDKIYQFQQEGDGGEWMSKSVLENPYGKIPIIYYGKAKPIWAGVQPLIERLETLLSNAGDTNDYHASPTLVFLNVKNATAQEKGETGKSVSMSGDKAEAKYVTWDQSVDAIKFESESLINFIYSLTQTPNISFEEMKDLGAMSGVAYDRVFIDAHLAARKEIEGGYGECVQRDINLQRSLLISMDTSVKPAMQALSVTFDVPHFKLEDLDADVDLAIKAKDGGLISVETAMGISGLVTNVQDEQKRIESEQSITVPDVA